MPSDHSYWLVSVPLEDGDPHRMFSEIGNRLLSDGGTASNDFAQLSFPPFKTGTLESLISLSDDLPKLDTAYTAIVTKTIDTLRALLNNDESALAQHILVNEQPVDDYILAWSWNTSKYRAADRSLRDIVDALGKELSSIDNVLKQKLNNYNIAKGQLQQLQRKKTGNLSVRNLADTVRRQDFVDPSSEFLDTLLVAVPKNSAREWQQKYERLTSMVVPRSSNKLAQDDEYALFNVTLFKKVRDEFTQKCRENKFIVREFEWDDEIVERQRQELDDAGASEKELWTELLRLSRTSFSESYQALAHLKVVRTFVESVLRYGLPSDYFALAIRPNPKRSKALLSTLVNHYAYLEGYEGQGPVAKRSQGRKGKKANSSGNGVEAPGEYAQLLEEEQFPCVLSEVLMVVV